MNKIKTTLFKKITISRISVLGMFVAIIIALKYALGFVPGIEVITFLFIIMGIFLPIFDLLLLVICFNLLVLIIYGFGTWWLVYWVIWPIDAFLSKITSKITKNRFVFGFLGFVLGFAIMFWYFLSSLIFYGQAKAIADLITALPINLIEGFTTMFCIIIIGPRVIKVLNYNSHKFWGEKKNFEFKPIKRKKIGYFMVIFLALISVLSTIILFINNSKFFEWKTKHLQETNQILKIGIKKPDGSLVGVAPIEKDGDVLLTTTSYNKLYNSLNKNEVGLVVIANGKSYIEKVFTKFKETVYDIMQKSKIFKFKYFTTMGLGKWIKTFKLKDEKNWRHGTSDSKNYGDYYPIYYINHKYAQLGVSNYHIKSREIYEITYDHNS